MAAVVKGEETHISSRISRPTLKLRFDLCCETRPERTAGRSALRVSVPAYPETHGGVHSLSRRHRTASSTSPPRSLPRYPSEALAAAAPNGDRRLGRYEPQDGHHLAQTEAREQQRCESKRRHRRLCLCRRPCEPRRNAVLPAVYECVMTSPLFQIESRLTHLAHTSRGSPFFVSYLLEVAKLIQGVRRRGYPPPSKFKLDAQNTPERPVTNPVPCSVEVPRACGKPLTCFQPAYLLLCFPWAQLLSW